MDNPSQKSVAPLITLAFVAIVPSLGLGGVEFGGIRLTLYRVVVPCVLAYMALSGKLTLMGLIKRPHVYWIALLVIWILYGLVLLLFSEYVNPRSGALEIVSLLYGLAVVAVFAQCDLDDVGVELVFRFVKVLLFVLIFIGMVEIVSGNHLQTSFYYDENRKWMLETNPHMATGFMHNVNDFSALITCLLPACLIGKNKVSLYVCVAFVALINAFNDATICNLGIAFAAGVYVAYVIKRKFHCNAIFAVVAAVALLGLVLLVLDSLFQMVLGFGLGRTIESQLANYSLEQGSLHHRLVLYGDSIVASADGWFLGRGPASFAGYFTENPSTSGLVNPHCFLLEVLFEYGAIVFLGLIFAFVMLFRTSLRHKGSGEISSSRRLAAFEFTLLLLISSFAPSSFIGFSFPWLVIALTCSALSSSQAQTVQKRRNV